MISPEIFHPRPILITFLALVIASSTLAAEYQISRPNTCPPTMYTQPSSAGMINRYRIPIYLCSRNNTTINVAPREQDHNLFVTLTTQQPALIYLTKTQFYNQLGSVIREEQYYRTMVMPRPDGYKYLFAFTIPFKSIEEVKVSYHLDVAWRYTGNEQRVFEFKRNIPAPIPVTNPGIYGRITTGICPVIRSGDPIEKCLKGYQARVRADQNGRLEGSAVSSQNGVYRLPFRPGEYSVSVEKLEPTVLPLIPAPQKTLVSDGQFSEVNFTLSSGIQTPSPILTQPSWPNDSPSTSPGIVQPSPNPLITPASRSGVRGNAVSTICPGIPSSRSNCQSRPQVVTFLIRRSDGSQIHKVTTDDHGHFEVALDPGDYQINGLPENETKNETKLGIISRPDIIPQTVSVKDNTFSELTLQYKPWLLPSSTIPTTTTDADASPPPTPSPTVPVIQNLKSGVKGKVVIGGCTAVRFNPNDPSAVPEGCFLRPYPTMVDVMDANNTTVLKTVSTNNNAEFNTELSPGVYIIVTQYPGSGGATKHPFEQPIHQQVTVVEGKFTEITLMIDNGLR